MAVAEFKVEVVSTETIKPSSPTPDELKTAFTISLFDQLSPAIYTPVLLFYHGEVSGSDGGEDVRPEELVSGKSRRLRLSLSDVLTRFYPLAGRIKENFWIDCGDGGVAYKEARVNCLLKDFLEKPVPAALKKLLPVAMESAEAGTGSLLAVQASFFECSGLAVGVCISHKVTDGASLGTFVRAWAGSGRDGSSGDVVAPNFAISSVFPPWEDLKNLPAVELAKDRCATRRYVLDPSGMAALRARASSTSVPRPTPVEAVSALIWKCASNATRRRLSDPSRPSVLSQAVNMRRVLAQPVAETSIGNLVGFFTARNEDPETDLPSLVNSLRASMSDYLETYPKILQGELETVAKTVLEAAGQFSSLMNSEDIDFYNCSSWCNLPLYESDFGWRRPVWVGLVELEFKNSIVLVESRDREGIEVWLTLRESDMAELDHDQELLEFALLNPAISLGNRL